eukprot:jgi/Psemu1/305577/fgenesh1_kg.206_\
MRSRYEWMDALNRLEKHPSSRDKIVSSWKEAKTTLEQVLNFPLDIPPESKPNNTFDSPPSQPFAPTSKKHVDDPESEIEKIREYVNGISVSPSAKWKQIAAYPDQERLFGRAKKGDQTQDDEYFQTRIQKESI